MREFRPITCKHPILNTLYHIEHFKGNGRRRKKKGCRENQQPASDRFIETLKKVAPLGLEPRTK